MLTLLARLLKILNSDDSPSQIALAVVLAFIMGMTPLMSPHNALLLLLVLLLRVNLSLYFLALALFTLFAYLFDPLFEWVGLALLQSDALRPLWTSLYDSSFWRLMGYNNTLILGSLCCSLLLSLPLFLLMRVLVQRYRQDVIQWAARSRLGMMVKGSKFYSLYSHIGGLSS